MGRAAASAAVFAAGLSLGVVMGAGLARAQETLTGENPRCAQMVNPAACNCALQSGGAFRPDGRGFTEGRGAASRAAYVECMRRAGRTP